MGHPWETAAALKAHKIEINAEFSKALQLMEGGSRNVLVTGKAGTGKSTLLALFVSRTRKKVAVLAPTGVAAVNVGGQTIHSFFHFRPDVTLGKIKKPWGEQKRLYEELDALVIDEASMVRADLFDCMDRSLRLSRGQKNMPFGGVRIILFGDLYQLAPVVTGKEKAMFAGNYPSPYFFDSQAFAAADFELLELEKIYRQSDASFISLLNAIRNNSAGESELQLLNARKSVRPQSSEGGLCVTLATTNQIADAINERELSSIRAQLHEFKARVKGDFGGEYFPARELLRVKEGAQVMLLNNDSGNRWVNGTVGVVTGFEHSVDGWTICVRLQDGSDVKVAHHTWTVFEYFYDARKGALDSRTIGSFTQYPLNLAWAVTIHKSQGKTFDRVHVDIGSGTFTPGQLYVALSRCRTIGGISLEKPVQKKHIFADWRVVRFATRCQYERSDRNIPLKMKMEMVGEAIRNKGVLEIVYLKASDVKSRRMVRPIEVDEMEYMGRKFVGMRAYCFERKGERVFRLDRVLEMARMHKNEVS